MSNRTANSKDGKKRLAFASEKTNPAISISSDNNTNQSIEEYSSAMHTIGTIFSSRTNVSNGGRDNAKQHRIVGMARNIFLPMIMIAMFYSFSAVGQTLNFPKPLIDSIQKLGFTYSNFERVKCDFSDYMPLMGEFMCIAASPKKILADDSNKELSVGFLCFENGCIKTETVFNISPPLQDYCNFYVYYGSEIDSIWTEEIILQTNNTGEIIINSATDVIAEIRRAFNNEPPGEYNGPTIITEFLVEGNKNEQTFQVDLEDDTSYIVLFKDSEDNIVNIKRIGEN